MNISPPLLMVFAVATVVAALALLAGGTTSAGPHEEPPLNLRSASGAGAGGANEVSQLSVSCDIEDAVIAGGFVGVDAGTQLQSSYAFDSDTWRVAWRNDETVDTVAVHILCSHGLGAGFWSLTDFPPASGGAANGAASRTLGCTGNGALAGGGFYALDPGSTLSGSNSFGDGEDWKVAWRNDATADKVGVRLICNTVGSDVNIRKAVLPGSGVRSGARACLQNESMLAGGFDGLAPGTRIIDSRPLTLNSWGVKVGSAGNEDPVNIYASCFPPP